MKTLFRNESNAIPGPIVWRYIMHDVVPNAGVKHVGLRMPNHNMFRMGTPYIRLERSKMIPHYL